MRWHFCLQRFFIVSHLTSSLIFVFQGGSAADVNVNELVADLVDEGSDVLDIFMPSTTSAAHSEPGVNGEFQPGRHCVYLLFSLYYSS